jgi:hypothetical protein
MMGETGVKVGQSLGCICMPSTVFLLGGHQLLLSFLWCDIFELQLDAQLLGNSLDLQSTDNEIEGVLMDQ